MRRFPRSLGFFLAAGLVMLLQVFPAVGGYLMFMAAALWSVPLINIGMAGLAYEALSRRIARGWLVVPLVFYGGYYGFALFDHVEFLRLRSEIAAANAAMHIPFDSKQGVLVATSRAQDGRGYDSLVQNFDLPVYYERDAKHAEVYFATRMIDTTTCAVLRANRSLSEAGVQTIGFEKRFCMVRQPERPNLPEFILARSTTSERVGTLPVSLASTAVTSPDGRRFHLRGGQAAPLRWFPMSVMGCFLNSARPSWLCDAGFMRAAHTPLLDHSRTEDLALANALGLKAVPPEERHGADAGMVLTLAARAGADALAIDLAQFETVVTDPGAKIDSAPFRVLGSRLDALTPRADAVMLGLERAAALTTRTQTNGLGLARLLVRLPRAHLVGFGPRILALYETADARHWLWQASELVDRLGDLGPRALPLLVAPAKGSNPARLRSVEAVCRLGEAGRALGPMLLQQWAAPQNIDDLEVLFVAMRRVGVEVPPLAEGKDVRGPKIAADWNDVSPDSPARVCATKAEKQARREEKQTGTQRVNED